jgi:hypothetical protein
LDHQPVLVGDRVEEPSVLDRGQGAGAFGDDPGGLGVLAGLKVMIRSRTARLDTEQVLPGRAVPILQATWTAPR